jgi:hypothetical protein
MALPWMRSLEQRGPIVGSTESSSKKKKQQNDVVYPVFLKCAEMEQEQEWKDLFTDLAHDRMPKGCNVRNKTLAYTDNYKTTPVRMDLEPDELRKQLVSLFSTKKGLVRAEEEVPLAPTVLPLSWKEVKRKIDRRMYILDYVCSTGSKLGWTKILEDRAYRDVSEWIDLGYIRQNEVVMENGIVKSVADVVVSETGVVLAGQNERKCKDSIQVVHLARLYQRLHRTTKKKAVAAEVVEEKSESTAS